MVRLVANPPNPWHSASVELLGPAPEARLQIYEEEARSALTANDSPDVPFGLSVNPYRGCFHACAYCYARPTHQYLDWGAGTDFDRRIVVKTNVAELLRGELARTRKVPETIAFAGVTDAWQPLEASYGLTRACLQACAEFRWPVGAITKGALIERDADLLRRCHERAGAAVHVSVPFVDDADGRALEPFAALPSRRLTTIARLAAAGVPVGVAIAPVIPGLNDHQIPAILEAAGDAGARSAFLVLLRLPREVRGVFEDRLREAFPERAERVLHTLREVRGDGSGAARFHARMRGSGARWEVVERLFAATCRRLGIAAGREEPLRRSPAAPRQGDLFDG
ncbi:MAG: radical SAM protein [Planctomycetes bacterium]|nr:radical SAM protein [Planctomycetota bacterium]